VSDVEVTAEILDELGLSYLLRSPHSRKQREAALFVKGPISLTWVCRVDVARHALAIALAVKVVVDITGGEPVHMPQAVWQLLGLSRPTRKRALDALERAGVIKTARLPGQAIQIWLLDKP
jgi:hypothetical protein